MNVSLNSRNDQAMRAKSAEIKKRVQDHIRQKIIVSSCFASPRSKDDNFSTFGYKTCPTTPKESSIITIEQPLPTTTPTIFSPVNKDSQKRLFLNANIREKTLSNLMNKTYLTYTKDQETLAPVA